MEDMGQDIKKRICPGNATFSSLYFERMEIAA
jgi:hypothetical protein